AYSGAFVWVLTFLILGNRLGRNWHVIFTFVKEYVWILAALGVMAVISLGFYFLFFRRKRHYNHIPIRSPKATVEYVSMVGLKDGCFSINKMTVDPNVKYPISSPFLNEDAACVIWMLLIFSAPILAIAMLPKAVLISEIMR